MSTKKAYISAAIPYTLRKEMDVAVNDGRFYNLSDIIRQGIRKVLNTKEAPQ